MGYLRFEKPGFVSDYAEALIEYSKAPDEAGSESPGGIGDDLYMDPDGVQDLQSTSYYNWLTLFLNLRAEECKKPYEFVSPTKAGINVRSEAKNPEGDLGNSGKTESDESKILVFDKEGNKVLRLTSDQLGFSALFGTYKYMNERRDNEESFYPLYRYFGLAEDKEMAAAFISEYVHDTRTLGGAFVWPTNSVEGDRKCTYNCKRGAKSNIEDRPDLTLLEVKSYFEKFEIKDVEGNEKIALLKNEVKNPSGENSMETFLDMFSSFDDYVDFFMLDDFVEDLGKGGNKDYAPKDIATGRPFERSEHGDFVIGKRLRDRALSESELEEILGRVQKWAMERTETMEGYLADQQEQPAKVLPFTLCRFSLSAMGHVNSESRYSKQERRPTRPPFSKPAICKCLSQPT